MIKHFESLLSIPDGLNAWQTQFLTGVKQNMDLLTGTAVATDHIAIVKGEIDTAAVVSQGITGSFDSADYLRMAQQVVLLTAAVNDLLQKLKQ